MKKSVAVFLSWLMLVSFAVTPVLAADMPDVASKERSGAQDILADTEENQLPPEEGALPAEDEPEPIAPEVPKQSQSSEAPSEPAGSSEEPETIPPADPLPEPEEVAESSEPVPGTAARAVGSATSQILSYEPLSQEVAFQSFAYKVGGLTTYSPAYASRYPDTHKDLVRPGSILAQVQTNTGVQENVEIPLVWNIDPKKPFPLYESGLYAFVAQPRGSYEFAQGVEAPTIQVRNYDAERYPLPYGYTEENYKVTFTVEGGQVAPPYKTLPGYWGTPVPSMQEYVNNRLSWKDQFYGTQSQFEIYVPQRSLLLYPYEVYVVYKAFNGWYREPECINRWNYLTDRVEGDITLYAGFSNINETIHFNSKGGTSVPSQDVIRGERITKPANPTRNGYVFLGWSTSDPTFYNIRLIDFDSYIVGESIVGEPTTFYAVWTTPEYVYVTFDSRGGNAVARQLVMQGGNAIDPRAPEMVGHRFVNWYLDARCTQRFDFTQPVLSDTRLYAKWRERKVKLNRNAVHLDVGKTSVLKDTETQVSNKTAKSSLETITWTSNKKSVATVDSKGRIKAVGKGKATVTAKLKNGSKSTVSVTVATPVSKPVSKLTTNAKKLTVQKGTSVKAKVTVLPKDASNKKLTWKTSNKKIATVNNSGKIVGKKPGKVTVTATSVDGSKALKFTVTVKK